MNSYDVLIVGGGPSGLRTASLLAKSGMSVLVAEKKRKIGENVICTGIVGKEIFSQFGLPTTPVIRDIDAVKVVSSAGNSLLYHHPFAFACVVDRLKFDRLLADEAERAGAEVVLGTCVTDIDRVNAHADVKLVQSDGAARTVAARLVVLATGIDHRLNKKMGLGVPRDYLLGAQAEREISNGNHATIFVGKSVAPGAFAWAVPTTGDRLRVGLVTSSEPRIWFENFMSRFYPDQMAGFYPEDIQVKPIAQGLVSRSVGDGVIVVGEAAGQVKTTTGGGIYFGLLCAQMAADVVSDCFRKASGFTAARLSAYEKAWRGAIQKEIIVGHYARRVFARLTDPQIERLFELAKTDGIVPLVQAKGRFDWQSDLILELVKKIPPVSYFSGIHKKLGLLDRFLS